MKFPGIFTIICIACALPVFGTALPDEVAFNARWAAQAFSGNPGSISSSEHLTIVHDDGPPGTKTGRASAGGTMKLGNKSYTRGIGVNSHNVMRVTLNHHAKRLLADIGVDRSMDGTVASLTFHVNAGDREIFKTGIMRGNGEVRSIDVPLNGATTIDLIVGNGGDDRTCDQADWADARIIMEDGKTVWLDDLASQAQLTADLPFSFVYGGRHSSEFIRTWSSRVEDKPAVDGVRRRTLTLNDPETGLEVRAVALIYTDSPGIDWKIYFTNTGSADTPVIEQVRAVDVRISPGIGSDPILHRLHGSVGAAKFTFDDFQPYDETITPGQKLEFGSSSAMSSYDVSPFFNLDWGGGGVITAIGWTGQWGSWVDSADDGNLRVQAGMKNMRLKLHPGETIRTPRILQVYWKNGDELRSYNLFRRTMLAHITPRVDGKIVELPFTYAATVTHEFNTTTEDIQQSYIKALRGLGFEYYWLDAYWIRDGFPNGMGNWGFPIKRVPDPKRFPRGLKPIGDALRRIGIKFMPWMGVETIQPGTDLVKEHSEWILGLPGAVGTFNLGDPTAREFMTKYLDTAIREYGLGGWFTDAGPSQDHWRIADKDPDRIGITEIRYVEGYYQLWDDILKAHPGFLIANCCGGGTRIDLETSARSLAIWRSDGGQWTLNAWKDIDKAAMQSQIIAAGLNRYIPFGGTGQMGVEPYYFRSAFNGGITFCDDIRPADYPREMLRQAIAEGKRIRKYFHGDFYPLHTSGNDSKDWCVMQYHRPNERDGLVMAFRRHDSPFSSIELSLRDIDPNAEYEVIRSFSYKPSRPIRIKGARLEKLPLEINERPGSLLLEYRKVDD